MVKTSARLLALLSVLQTRRDWSGRDLAARLDVSPRTVRRDVDRLRELGYPITTFKGPEGGYRLDAGSRMPPLLFDDDQAVALAVALQAATATGAGIGEAAERALNTVRQVMPARLRRRIDAVRAAVVAPPDARRARADGGLLTAISAAVHAREELRLDYTPAFRSASDRDGAAVEPRRVQPHHLVTRAGRWYLLAWDVERGEWRTLRVDRIALRSPNGPRFTPREVPGGDVASFLTSRFRGSDGTVDWPCRGEVILDLPAAAVVPFAHDGLVEEMGAERCRLVLGSWSWVGLASAIGRFDADFEVVGPPELEDAFARLARRYGGGGRQARAPER
ncbi:helix-turn-helix transcriptional regulator [Nocardiopsis alborubida]|uniref:WYL domain-containing protein n=1 Tax=Nocardiopsis alborubida TaxID=146802 RepID=A0A7X6MAJ5_9ACTN|nr:WYL domain-containing protein [Nocardiopsis alborubida]NKY97801.1 WYL domain-containing protein [Nocardiopsis alborubida]